MAADDQNDGAGFTETTTKSWFTRLREAFGGILTGAVLLVASVVLLFWNEGRAVKSADALHEGAAQVIAVTANVIAPQTEGKLVHLAGQIRVNAPPRDPEFGFAAPGVRLERKVEMYQWQEKKSVTTEKKLGGGEETVTRYSYERVWSETPHASESFRQPQGHANPPFPLRSASFSASAKLGAREISARQTGSLGRAEPFSLDARQVAQIGTKLGRPAILAEGGALLGADPARPQVGDIRITYAAARVETASFVAKQSGAELVPFVASNGRSLFLAREGAVPAAQMFDAAIAANSTLTWLLRGFGLLLAIGGFRFVLRIASVLADVVPPLGNLVALGTGFLAIVLGGALSSLIAGFAWIFHRPMIGAGLLLLAAFAFLLVLRRSGGSARAGTGIPA